MSEAHIIRRCKSSPPLAYLDSAIVILLKWASFSLLSGFYSSLTLALVASRLLIPGMLLLSGMWASFHHFRKRSFLVGSSFPAGCFSFVCGLLSASHN